jgi:UDP-GlcNAc:undecaprenyl-phosphate GlcNAc-1-phosphate transferase
VQGLLKTAALATLVLPLLVLAVPLLDTSFVVARRIKHGQPVYLGDRQHLHHRFEAIGFSQRRAVVYLYAWCVTLAGAALATKFLHPHPHGQWHPAATVAAVLIGVAALGASVYIAYLLEIVKLANPRIRRREDELRETRKSA